MNTSPSLNKELAAKEREAFEAWAGSTDSWLPNIKRWGEAYESAVTAAGWHAWQARASTPSALHVEGAGPSDAELFAPARKCGISAPAMNHDTDSMPEQWPAAEPQKDWQADPLDIVRTIALALERGYAPSDILDENSPIRDRIRLAAHGMANGEVTP